MNCSICNTVAPVVISQISGYCQGTTFKIAHCANCNTNFSLPLRSDSKIYESIYSQVEKIPGYSRYFQIAEAVKHSKKPLEILMRQEEAYWGISHALARSARPKEKIVEIGCGQGYLTYSLVKAGYSAVGLDISSVAVELARSRYGDFYMLGSIESYIENVDEAPMYMVMSEVVEHLENPLEIIRAAFSALAPGGSLILTTPNKDAYQNAVWDTDLPPVHLYWFSYESFRKIGAILNAEIEFFNFEKYYQSYPKIKYPADAGKGHRSSILSSSGEVITSASSSPIGKDFRSMIPAKITAPLKRLVAQKRGMHLFSAENPGTICVTLRKLPNLELIT